MFLSALGICAGAPGDLLLKLIAQLLVLFHKLVVMLALHVVLDERKGCLVKLLLRLGRQQRAVLALKAGDVHDHKAAVLLGELEEPQLFGDLKP